MGELPNIQASAGAIIDHRMTRLGALLRKELQWSKHNLALLLFLLVVLPGGFAYTTTAFGEVIPEDAPVALAPQTETVTDADLGATKAVVTMYSAPREYESVTAARTVLTREEVYAIVAVPPNVTSGDDLRFTLYVDGSIVPYQEPSKAITGIINYHLQRSLDANVRVDREVVGPERTLSEYLVPVGLMLIVLLLAFAYLPYNLAREERVFDRVRLSASLHTVIASKLVFTTALLAVPFGAFHIMVDVLGYDITVFTPTVLGIYGLTFLYLAMLSTSVMLVTKFSTLGRFVNIVLLFVGLLFANMVYPAGFFSPLRRELARWIPLHYSMILARSEMLKPVSLMLFTDWVAALLGVTAVAAIVLTLSTTYYARTANP